MQSSTDHSLQFSLWRNWVESLGNREEQSG